MKMLNTIEAGTVLTLDDYNKKYMVIIHDEYSDGTTTYNLVNLTDHRLFFCHEQSLDELEVQLYKTYTVEVLEP